MRFFKILSLVILSITMVMAQSPTFVLQLDWGSQNDQVGFRQAPEANYGPSAFVIQNDSVILLDAVQQKLKFFKNRHWLKSIPIVPFADDMAFKHENDFLILAANKLFFYRNGHLVKHLQPASPQHIIEKVEPVAMGSYLLQFNDQQTMLVSPLQQVLKKDDAGKNSFSQKIPKLTRLSTRTILVQIGQLQKEFSFNNQEVASVRFLGIDTFNHYYLSLEFFEQQVPLKVKREIQIFDENLNLLLRLQVPVNNYTEIYRDWYIAPNGSFYQMFSTSRGIKIVKWDFSSYLQNTQPTFIRYPQNYFEGKHYNYLIPSIEGEEATLQKTSQFEDYPQIMPTDALAIADQYVQLSWNCTQDNLTNGVVTDQYGNKVRTPDWIQVGQNEQVPYKWGGFESIEAFLNGIDILKYAGDNYTDDGGTPSAVGVDCSGFVSRCWNLPTHYSTSMMDDGLTLPYNSWQEAEPGDAVHKVGHVRLIVKQNGNGSLTVAESSGRDWRVSYRTYYYSSLDGYTPRYYVNRQGAPGNIPQPRIDRALVTEEQLHLYWSLEGLENVSTLHLYLSEDATNWTTDLTIPKDTTHWTIPINNQQQIYARLKSFSTDAQATPSLPSDAYGGFRNDGNSPVLIVDGFDRNSATSGRWKYLYHNFAARLGQSLALQQIPFETTTNEQVKNGYIDLNHYPAVFWLLGDESTHDATFDLWEQDPVKEYLKNGGCLFVSGSEVGWDLVAKGTNYDKRFFEDYLKTNYQSDDANSYQANGVAGSPFDGLVLHFDDGTHGTYDVPYPDVLTPTGGSAQALNYANGQGAATYFEGLVPEGTKKAKVFLMGFPFETIYNQSERDSLMKHVVAFFGLTGVSHLAANHPSIPVAFDLHGNFPNPFNNQTKIYFTIGAPGQIELFIFNALGQQVWHRHYHFTSAGQKNILVNGVAFASGLYFYRLTYQGAGKVINRTGKMILIK